jgi:hypothetical protein
MRSTDSETRGSTAVPRFDRIGGIERSTVRATVRGIVGGLVATVLMTLYRFPLFRALPPTAEFWAMYVGGGEPEEYFSEGLVLHFLYGGVAGGLFGAAFSRLLFRSERDRRLAAIGLSLGYGLVLSVFGTRVVFKRLLDETLEPDEGIVFHVGHAIYGLTLGTWLSSRARTGEMYD